MPFETDQRAHRHAELRDLFRTAEFRQVDDEARGQYVAADLDPECRLGRFSIIRI
jgi:hypothetical protein